MSDLSTLSAAWSTEIAKIGNAIIKAKATIALTDYIAALTAHSYLASKTLDSYSISGRSYTFKDTDKLRAYTLQLETELVRLVYGSNTSSAVVMNPDYQVIG